jgi:WD40 repeat protein
MAAPALSRLCVKKDAHEDSVWSLAWSSLPGAAQPALLTGGLDESVKSWRVDEAGEGLSAVEEYTGEAVSVLGVVSVAASDTGLAATCSLDSTVRVWDLASNTHKAALELPPGEAWCLAFAPGDAGARRLAVAGGLTASVALFDLEADAASAREAVFSLPSEVRRRDRPPRPPHAPQVVEADAAGSFVLSVAFSPDGSLLACGSMGGCVALFDAATRTLLRTLPGLSKAVRGLSWAQGSLAAACDDGHVHVYEAASGQLLRDYCGHDGAALCVSCAPDGSGALATGGADASVRVWDARTGRCSQSLTSEHSQPVWAVAYSPGGGHVASCSDDKSVALYQVAA